MKMFLRAIVTVVLVACANAAAAQQPTPWGISSSASSFRNHQEWLPKMQAAGVTTVRLFPEWRGVEPKPGDWKWENPDALVAAAAKNKIEIHGVLMGSPPAYNKIHAFPMNDLAGWSKFVGNSVERYKDKIHYWEVWNEGNGGFNDDKHTTADYAKLAVATYDAAKKADPKAQVGLTVASYDPDYLQNTIAAMKKAGTPDRFDYLCVHPYEIADGLADPDGEIPYLWMTHTLRGMLKQHAPEREQCEIWISEVGRRLGKQGGRTTSEETAAGDLVKLYVMALAQGINRVEWFEAQDPAGEDQGFGLIGRDGKERLSYGALQRMTALLGPNPKYLGWIGAEYYGFVFQGAEEPVLVAWMPKGASPPPLRDAGGAKFVDAVSGHELQSKSPMQLSDRPMFVTKLPAAFVKEAAANKARPFPWGGDHSKAKTVSLQLGVKEGSSGVFHVGRDSAPTIKFPDGSTGILLRGDQSAQFYVHPSFASLQQREYYVRVTVRRVAPGNLGMNVFYEGADSQGRVAYKNRGIWYGVGPDEGWQTHTWHLTDAAFAKMWGNDFSFRPEQSVPFVIGKVEVSLEPFGK